MLRVPPRKKLGKSRGTLLPRPQSCAILARREVCKMAESARPPEKLRPWHERLADRLIADPRLTQRTLAQEFGKTEGWVSIVINCDAFKEYMASRKGEFVDPVIAASIDEKFRGVASLAAEKLIDRITTGSVSNRELIEAMDKSAKGLGMGAAKTPAIQQNLYVLPNPGRPQTSQEWVEIVEQQGKLA